MKTAVNNLKSFSRAMQAILADPKIKEKLKELL